MGWISNDGKKMVLDWYCLGASPTRPPAWFAALMTTMPDKDGAGGVECSGTGYARVATTLGAATDASPSLVASTAEIDFGTGNPDWGDIAGVAFYTADTAGVFLGAHQLATPVQITADPVTIPVGDVDISLADA